LSSGYPVLASVPYPTTSDRINEHVGMSKPSQKGLLDLPVNQHTYSNPGHHDPTSKGLYNPQKSVLPANHVDLFRNSQPIIAPDGKLTRWTKEGTGKNAVYHRFEEHLNGEFHWTGSTDGKTKSGKERKIEDHNVPSCIKK
jgi:filamentous hemagglutinin